MVPSPTDFGYTARVCAAGYRWASVGELGAKPFLMLGRMSSLEVQKVGLLVEILPDGEREEVLRQPCANPALFREFADLNSDDLGSLVLFANAHGPLGVSDFVELTKSGPETGLKCTSMDDYWRGHPYRVVLEKPDKVVPQISVETHTAWAECITGLRIAVGVFDAIRAGNTKKLHSHFRWRPMRHSLSGMPLGSWHIVTDPEPPEESREEWATSLVYGEHIGAQFDSIETVAMTYLVRAVNWQIETVHPALVLGPGGKLTESLSPRTLLSAMWAQLYGALTGGKSYDQCRACGKWFEVTGRRGGHTVRRMHCSDACRVRVYRDRRERAEQLAGEGLKPAAIVERLKGEGHETDFATVKKWVKAKRDN